MGWLLDSREIEIKMKTSFENVNYHSIQVLLEVVQKENTSSDCNIVNAFHNSNEEPRTLSYILKLLNIKIRKSNAMHVWMVTEALRIPNFTFAVNLSLHPSEVDKLNITANSRIVLLNKLSICLFSEDTYAFLPSIRSYHIFSKWTNSEEEINVKFVWYFSFSIALYVREWFLSSIKSRRDDINSTENLHLDT